MLELLYKAAGGQQVLSLDVVVTAIGVIFGNTPLPMSYNNLGPRPTLSAPTHLLLESWRHWQHICVHVFGNRCVYRDDPSIVHQSSTFA